MELRTAIIALAACFVLAACGGQGGSSGIASSDRQAGAEQFEIHCDKCHPNGQEATGPALLNLRYEPAYMRKWIREGSERMRPIPPERLSDADMESLLAFMVTLSAVEGD